jgi:hypothetical protein
MWGWAVIIVLLSVAAPALWWAIRFDEHLPVEEGGSAQGGGADETQVLPRPGEPTEIIDAASTQVIRIIPARGDTEALIVDIRPIPDAPRTRAVIDELGEWIPTDHVLDQPLILGHVLMSRAWDGVSLSQMGLVAA